jgi:hypothetical protein
MKSGGLCLALSGTSNAIGDIGGATTDFMSTTTPGATYGNHTLARAKKKTELFTIYGYENIRSDVARGSGEYLRSLGTLAGVLISVCNAELVHEHVRQFCSTP